MQTLTFHSKVLFLDLIFKFVFHCFISPHEFCNTFHLDPLSLTVIGLFFFNSDANFYISYQYYLFVHLPFDKTCHNMQQGIIVGAQFLEKVCQLWHFISKFYWFCCLTIHATICSPFHCSWNCFKSNTTFVFSIHFFFSTHVF